VRFVGQSWISTFLNSANNAENISVSTSPERKMPVQNLTPAILGIIIVPLVWTIYSFAEFVASTVRGGDGFQLKITFARNAEGCPIVRSD